VRRPQGNLSIFMEEDGETRNYDTFTCAHCQYITVVKPRMDPADMGGLCKQCMGLICRACVAYGQCTTWEAQMEKIESRDRFRRQCGLG